jgi:cytochrome c oxidase assembly factor CtaG
MIASFIGAGVGLLFWLIFAVLGLAAFIFWIAMLIHAIQNRRLSGGQKLVWVLVIIFLHFLGALIYYFVGRDES